MRGLFAAAAAAAAALGAAGCKDKNADQPTTPGVTVRVTGKVTYNGKVVPAGSVRFMAEEGRAEGFARIKKDGTYSVAAPAGKVRVTVDTSMVKDEYDDPAERKKWYVPVPSRYAPYTETPVRVTTAGEQMELDLPLADG
jgi:hypothetical protein